MTVVLGEVTNLDGSAYKHELYSSQSGLGDDT